MATLHAPTLFPPREALRKTPPLEPGDRLMLPEFERRYNAMPWLKKAELVEGIVYFTPPSSNRYLGQTAGIARDAKGAILPLEHGDHLTRQEFERRCSAMPHLKKAELIEGIVYMVPPVSAAFHGRPHFRVIGWLSQYATATPGVDGGDNASLRLDLQNEPQPDAYLRILPGHGGTTREDEDGFILGAPELVVEVAASSVSYDLHIKSDLYCRQGVREYLVWRVYDEAIDWFALRDGRFERLVQADDGKLRSEAFPGLWLDVAAMLKGDVAAVAAYLNQGIVSPEHQQFAQKLQEAQRLA